MKIVKLDLDTIPNKILKKASEIIKKGGILVYPTDTCYGLGINPENKIALKKLAKLKGRPESKKFSYLVSDIEMIKKLCKVNKKQEKILVKNLPGGFTFILKMKNKNQTLGIRIPDFEFTDMLSKELGIPFTTTSANLSGKPECFDINCILNQFKNQKNQLNLVLDAGKLEKTLPSTVVDLTVTTPKILRKGSGKLVL
ncbi:MAG: L-threonylcarbamoyladenylate synthase [Candidatus Berkelbacteria bacterium]|nr:L-threonylcarbamoyladenylate synthase [Candidatus Berkelbacteria bacterium]